MAKERFGKLKPRYTFFLNPYEDVRFSSCPKCERLTRLRKFALLIIVESAGVIVLGKTCRFCPACDLIIAHKDELESLLVSAFSEIDPDAIGEDYFVIGTVDRKTYRAGLRGEKLGSDAQASTADFKNYIDVEYKPAGWYPAEE